MGPGDEKVPIEYYNYRTEFQARGLPHVHGVLWVAQHWLEKEGITGSLVDNQEGAEILANLTMSCSLPDNDEQIKQTASEVQRHKHTKSCRKTGKACRFGFPKLPMQETVVAKPLPSEMSEDEKEIKLKKAKELRIC